MAHSGTADVQPGGRKPGGIIIRAMEIDDLHDVFVMGGDMFRRHNEFRYYGRWNEENLASLFAEYPEFALAAVRKKQLLGFVLGGLIQGADAPDAGYILWSGVKDRGKFHGILEALLEALFTVMRDRGLKTIFCRVEHGDSMVERWCHEHGFSSVEQHDVKKWVDA